jgi:hypothetical protein
MEYANAEPAGSASSLEFLCLRLDTISFGGVGSVLLAYRSHFRETLPHCARRRW